MVTEGLIVKFIGSFFGSILALVFIVPNTLAGFFRRAFFSLTSGVIFAPTTLEWLGWTVTNDHWIAASALTAFASWYLTGVGFAIATKWASEKTKD